MQPTFALMAPQSELDAAYRRSSAAMLKVLGKRRRLQQAVSEAQARLPGGVWEHFMALCRNAHAIDDAVGVLYCSKRHRGAGRQWLIGQRQQLRPMRHVQRKEQQAVRQRERHRAAKAYRAERVAQLRSALVGNNAAALIDSSSHKK